MISPYHSRSFWVIFLYQMISSDILSRISFDILSGISFDILPGISSNILSGISSDMLSGISSDMLSGILSGILFGILYGFVCGRWGAVEVGRGPQRSDSRRLKSGEAHSAQTLARWSPARPTAVRLSPIEVWRGPQRSRASSWGPARTTAIKRWQMMSGNDHCDQGLADEVRPGPLEVRRGGRRKRKEKEEERGELDRGAAHLT